MEYMHLRFRHSIDPQGTQYTRKTRQSMTNRGCSLRTGLPQDSNTFRQGTRRTCHHYHHLFVRVDTRYTNRRIQLQNRQRTTYTILPRWMSDQKNMEYMHLRFRHSIDPQGIYYTLCSPQLRHSL